MNVKGKRLAARTSVARQARLSDALSARFPSVPEHLDRHREEPGGGLLNAVAVVEDDAAREAFAGGALQARQALEVLRPHARVRLDFDTDDMARRAFQDQIDFDLILPRRVRAAPAAIIRRISLSPGVRGTRPGARPGHEDRSPSASRANDAVSDGFPCIQGMTESARE